MPSSVPYVSGKDLFESDEKNKSDIHLSVNNFIFFFKYPLLLFRDGKSVFFLRSTVLSWKFRFISHLH